MSPSLPKSSAIGGDAVSRTVHAAPARRLAHLVSGYIDYREHTAPLTRREVPALQWVLIVNLGAPIRITDGDGRRLCLGAGEGFVTGLHDRHALSHSDGSQAGVHVWLTDRGAAALLGNAAGAMRNQAVKLPDIFGPGGADLGGRLLDAATSQGRFAALDGALCRWVGREHPERPEMAWAFAQLRRHPARSVASLADEIGCSRQTLSARFRARFGVAPKTAARLARFERVIASLGPGPPAWAAIAQDAGYFDQSHMIRDFTGFAGLTPAEYVTRLSQDGGVVEPSR